MVGILQPNLCREALKTDSFRRSRRPFYYRCGRAASDGWRDGLARQGSSIGCRSQRLQHAFQYGGRDQKRSWPRRSATRDRGSSSGPHRMFWHTGLVSPLLSPHAGIRTGRTARESVHGVYPCPRTGAKAHVGTRAARRLRLPQTEKRPRLFASALCWQPV